MLILQKLTRITIYAISFGRYINFLVVFKEFLETIPDVQQILAVRYMELVAENESFFCDYYFIVDHHLPLLLLLSFSKKISSLLLVALVVTSNK